MFIMYDNISGFYIKIYTKLAFSCRNTKFLEHPFSDDMVLTGHRK